MFWMSLRLSAVAVSIACALCASGKREDLWSLKKVAPPPVPQGVTASSNPIDAFLWKDFESKGLKPLDSADKATLLRRVHLDLIGIPPTPDELNAFLRNTSPDAYRNVVDELLAREQYGERYARRWLDVLRYADVDENMPAEAGIYLWRDWVISDLNRDLPYDRFAEAQIMGDLSSQPDDIFATGFLARAAHSREDKNQELALGAVETISSAFMGMTVGCAKCHDHMFDPIAQKDFYAMKALFDPLALEKKTLATADQIVAYGRTMEEYRKKREALEKPLKDFAGPFEEKLREERILMLAPEVQPVIRKDEKTRTPEEQKIADDYAPILRIDPPKIREIMTEEQRGKYDALRKPLQDLKAPEALPVFWTVREDSKRAESKSFILLGGDPEKPGAEVSPGFPFAPEALSFHSGRRRTFVDWLTGPENPLFARVAVNRLWQWHFGEGLAPTPSDFGFMGDAPTHPDLLDWLASEFVRQKFSMKAMHRLMVTSEAYQMASTGDKALLEHNARIDPTNTSLWRFRLQRLDAEAVRDSILWAAGDLDLTVGGRSFRDGPEQKRLGSGDVIGEFDTRSNRRAIYMGRGFHSDREMMPGFLQVFDADDGRRPCPRRTQTVTAPQALTLMNSELVHSSAKKLAERLLNESDGETASAVDLGYRITLSRDPSAREKDRALTYVGEDDRRLEGFAWLLFNLDEFVYIR